MLIKLWAWILACHFYNCHLATLSHCPSEPRWWVCGPSWRSGRQLPPRCRRRPSHRWPGCACRWWARDRARRCGGVSSVSGFWEPTGNLSTLCRRSSSRKGLMLQKGRHLKKKVDRINIFSWSWELITYDTNVDYTPAAIALSSPDPGGRNVFHPGRL